MSDDTNLDTAAQTASKRIREFEDRELGEHVVRISGKIERGFGSKFKELSEKKQAHYAKLEKLAEAEQDLTDAKTSVLNATNAYNAALAAVDAPEVPHADE